MPQGQGWVSIAIAAATLAMILVRPRGVSEAWVAAAGAAVMVAAGPMRLGDIPAVLGETADVVLFLAGMMVLSALVEGAGLFELLAEGCARLARGSGVALFCLVFLLGAVVTALLSLDVTVIVLTPIVFAVATRRRLDPLPFVFACTFVANTASLALPISNLTNLLVYHRLGIGFTAFAGRMWLPNLAAAATNLAVFLWLFRSRIPRRLPGGAVPLPPPADWWLATAAGVLAATLAALVGLGLAGRPLSWAALAGAGLLLAIGLAGRRVGVGALRRDVSWPVLVFVVGMLVVVRGLERGWLDVVTIGTPASPARALAAGVAASAIGSNLVNNVPMALLALPVVERAGGPAREALAYGVLIGCDIGPTLTTYGSLATLLWLALVRRRGLDVSTRDYMRVALLTTPPVLLAASLGLWIALR